MRRKEFDSAIAGSVQVALQSLVSGQRVAPFDRGFRKIESMFKDFIATREAERSGINAAAGLLGFNSYRVPTMAALRGVNHRLAHPYARSNPRRPSFLDTGLYSSSFVIWSD